jgi:hypothetical protein
MANLIKNRLALSTVVTALTILIISVLLVSVISFYAENMVGTQTKVGVLSLANQHIWNNPNSSPGKHDYSQVAFMIVNSAGKDMVIERVSVLGENCRWDDVTTLNGVTTGQFIEYYSKSTPIGGELQFQTHFNAGPAPAPTDNEVTIAGQDYTFTVATGPLIIKSGYTMVIYVVNPSGIDFNKIGMTVGICVCTNEAAYNVEANIQGLNS